MVKNILNLLNIIKKEQLWRAPELQSPFIGSNSNSATQFLAGTPKGDVYSFAIIVQEILYRKGVFYINDEDRENTFKVNENYERNQTSNHIQVTNPGKNLSSIVWFKLKQNFNLDF